MRFSILALFVAIVVSAFAFLTIDLSYSRYWSDSVKLIYACIFASALVYSFDRRSTPALAFGVFGILFAYYATPSTFGFALILERLGFLDREVRENLEAIRTLQHHLAMCGALLAWAVWKVLSGYSRKPIQTPH